MRHAHCADNICSRWRHGRRVKQPGSEPLKDRYRDLQDTFLVSHFETLYGHEKQQRRTADSQY